MRSSAWRGYKQQGVSLSLAFYAGFRALFDLFLVSTDRFKCYGKDVEGGVGLHQETDQELSFLMVEALLIKLSPKGSSSKAQALRSFLTKEFRFDSLSSCTPSKSRSATKPSLPPDHVTLWLHLGSLTREEFLSAKGFLARRPCEKQVVSGTLLLDLGEALLRRALLARRFFWIFPTFLSLKHALEELAREFSLKDLLDFVSHRAVHLIPLKEEASLGDQGAQEELLDAFSLAPEEKQHGSIFDAEMHFSLEQTQQKLSWISAGAGYALTCSKAMGGERIGEQSLIDLLAARFAKLRRDASALVFEIESMISQKKKMRGGERPCEVGESAAAQLLRMSGQQRSQRGALDLWLARDREKRERGLEVMGPRGTLLLCGAGPSLSDLLPHLVARSDGLGASDRLTMAAVGSALPLLERHGVKPHLFFAVDPFIAQERRLRSVGSIDTPLIYRPRWHQGARALFIGPRLLAGGSCGYFGIDEALCLLDEKVLRVDEGVNVVGFALQWARAMLFERVILVGVDLAQVGGALYAREGKEKSALEESWSGARLAKERGLWGRCVDGVERPTSAQWQIERAYLEEFGRQNPSIKLERYAPQGLEVACKHVSLEELLSVLGAQRDLVGEVWRYAMAQEDFEESAPASFARESLEQSLGCARATFEMIEKELRACESAQEVREKLGKLESSRFYREFLQLWDKIFVARTYPLALELERMPGDESFRAYFSCKSEGAAQEREQKPALDARMLELFRAQFLGAALERIDGIIR